MARTASQPVAEPDPLDEAQLEHEAEAADADVARLTKAIAELTKKGPGADPVLLARLQAELEGAQKILRRVDLDAAETITAASAPLSPKVLQKIRLRRRRVEDLHAASLARMGESRRLYEHLGVVKSEITALKNAWEFRADQREVRNSYLSPRDAESNDHPAPARGGQKTPKSMEALARLERDFETTAAELRIAAAAQVAASARWEAEKRVLDGWESAVRSLGPAARAVIDAMPRPGAVTLGEVTRETDFRDGAPGYTQPMIR